MIQIEPLFNYSNAAYYVVYSIDREKKLLHVAIHKPSHNTGIPYVFAIVDGEISQVADPASYVDAKKTEELNVFLRTHIPRKEYVD